MILRPYTPDDFEAVCAVHDRSRPYELAGSTDPRGFRPMVEEADAEEFFVSETIVACIDDRIVGFVSFYDAYITWLYVDPEFFRQGIGRRLLAEAVKRIGPEAWVNTMGGYEAALAMYQSAGFVVVKEFASDCVGYPCTCARLALPTSRMSDPNNHR